MSSTDLLCTLHCFSSCVELWRYITLLTPTMHLTTTTIEIRATLQSAQFLLLLWSLETSSTWNCCSYSNSDRTLWWFSVDLMKGPSKWLNVRCYLCVLVCICLCLCINFLLMFVYLLEFCVYGCVGVIIAVHGYVWVIILCAWLCMYNNYVYGWVSVII